MKKVKGGDARYCLEGKRFHLTCFLAQQAAEKALKAFLYAKEEERVLGQVAETSRKPQCWTNTISLQDTRMDSLGEFPLMPLTKQTLKELSH